jgi:2-iminobutanoate/2-iminopropanoate deaminase
MKRMKTISTEKAPRPAGHYSQAVVCGGVVYVAGQLGGDPAQPGEPAGGAGGQTKQAMANVAAVLAAAGSGLGNILQSTIYVTDIELWAEVNEAYAEAMGDHRPSRAVVPIGPLRAGYLVEIQVIAALA